MSKFRSKTAAAAAHAPLVLLGAALLLAAAHAPQADDLAGAPDATRASASTTVAPARAESSADPASPALAWSDASALIDFTHVFPQEPRTDSVPVARLALEPR